MTTSANGDQKVSPTENEDFEARGDAGDARLPVTGRFRKKHPVVDAVQWWRNGDHPLDDSHLLEPGDSTTQFEPFLSEGKIVRRHLTPEMNGHHQCPRCSRIMHDHGWIETPEAGYIVCPGDFIIQGAQDEFYPCEPLIFQATYEPADGVTVTISRADLDLVMSGFVMFLPDDVLPRAQAAYERIAALLGAQK